VPDLDHLRRGGAGCVADAHALGAHVDRGQHLELERPVDGKGPADALRDQRLDAALVASQIAEGEVKQDQEQQRSRDGKDDADEAAQRHGLPGPG
jgi:hypothetical protein